MDPHRLAELRSIAMHRAVAARVKEQPTLVTRARARIDGWAASGRIHPRYAQAWRELLSAEVDVLCERLIADDEEHRALRQSTPFAGVLSAAERWAIWRQARAEAEQ